METEKLLAAALDGDSGAFEQLVRSQAARLYRIAYRVTADREAADDVLQETFLRLLSAAQPAEPIRSGDSWLARVTTRIALNLLKSQRAYRSREERYAVEQKRKAQENSSERPRPADLEPDVAAAFQTLPPVTRAAIWLHVVEGEGVREVAACLESSRSAISRRIHAGLAKMREHLRARGCALPAMTSVEKLLGKLTCPSPDPPLLEAILALGTAPRSTASAPRARTPRGEARAAWRGGLFGSKVVTLSVMLSLTLVAAFAGLLLLQKGREFTQPVRPRLLEVATSEGAGGAVWRDEGGEGAATTAPQDRETVLEGESPARVRGTVVFEGRPVGGARVRARVISLEARLGWSFERLYVRGEIAAFLDVAFDVPQIFAETSADAAGRFELGVPEDGSVVLEAVAAVGDEGFLGGLQPVDVPEDMQEEILISVSSDAFLSGTVRDSEGGGVAGAAVAAFPVHDDLYRACTGTGDPSYLGDHGDRVDAIYHRLRETIEFFELSCATTEPDGSFLFPWLDPGDAYLVAVRSPGSPGAFRGPVKLPVADMEIDVPKRMTLPGEAVILPGEAPAIGAKVFVAGGTRSPGEQRGWLGRTWFEVLQSDSAGWFDVTESDSSGRFAIRGGELGLAGFALGILEHSGAFHSARAGWSADHGTELPLRIEFERRIHTSEGRVLDALTGLPIAGARVLYHSTAHGVSFAADEDTTDAAGRFSLVTAGDPNGIIIAEVEGYAPGGRLGEEHKYSPSARSPAARNILSSKDILLLPSPLLRGTVTGADGLPVRGCQLRVWTCTPVSHPVAFLFERLEVASPAEFNRWVYQVYRQENKTGPTDWTPPVCRAFSGDDGEFEIRQPYGHEGLFLWAHHSEMGDMFAGPLSGSSDNPSELRIDLRLPGTAVVELIVTGGAEEVLPGVPVVLETVPSSEFEDECRRRWEKLRDDREEGGGPIDAATIDPGLRTGETDRFGNCHLAVSAGVSFRVSVQKPRPDASSSSQWGWSCSLIASRPLQAGETRTIVLPFPTDRTLRGRVSGADGKGVRAALSVHCSYEPLPGSAVTGTYATGGESAEDGAFAIAAAGPGPFDVTVRARGYREAKLEDVQAGLGETRVLLERE